MEFLASARATRFPDFDACDSGRSRTGISGATLSYVAKDPSHMCTLIVRRGAKPRARQEPDGRATEGGRPQVPRETSGLRQRRHDVLSNGLERSPRSHASRWRTGRRQPAASSHSNDRSGRGAAPRAPAGVPRHRARRPHGPDHRRAGRRQSPGRARCRTTRRRDHPAGGRDVSGPVHPSQQSRRGLDHRPDQCPGQ